MKTVSAFLVLTAAALTKAQSHCLTAAAEIPSCGVRNPSSNNSIQFSLTCP